jgi:hypothetical protein
LPNVILTLFPAADRLLESTDVELERAVLLRVVECCAEPTRTRRVRRCELFTGALGELRNPKAHQDPAITDPMVAVEEMMVASTLLRIVDSA